MAQLPFKKGQLSHLYVSTKNYIVFCNLLHCFPPIFSSEHQAAFVGHAHIDGAPKNSGTLLDAN
jgi:hypothetical protein